MAPTFEDYGLTVADAQSAMSANLHPRMLLALCHGIYTCIFLVALYYIGNEHAFITTSGLTSLVAESTQLTRKRIILASTITFLWCTSTIVVGLQWHSVNETFIKHGLSLDDEFNFAISGGTETLTGSVFRALNTILADLILVCAFTQALFSTTANLID